MIDKLLKLKSLGGEKKQLHEVGCVWSLYQHITLARCFNIFKRANDMDWYWKPNSFGIKSIDVRTWNPFSLVK